MDERIIKMKELMQDEAFVKELCAKANAEELRACFGEHGIEMSPEEINQIIECAERSAAEKSTLKRSGTQILKRCRWTILTRWPAASCRSSSSA